jgi:hypothetical protein
MFRAAIGFTLVAVSVISAACSDGPSALKHPPQLRVTTPERSLRLAAAGTIMVSGQTSPNADSNEPVTEVSVNGVAAEVGRDGMFHAEIKVPLGAMLIHTIARDAGGAEASDTRSVQVGPLQAVGTNVADAVLASISTPGFAKLGTAAARLLKTGDIASLLMPLQPMIHAGDENGEDCSYGQVFVEDVNVGDALITLVPSWEGLHVRVQLDGLAVAMRAKYASLCVPGMKNLQVTSDRMVITGVFEISADDAQGLQLALGDERFEVTNLDLDTDGIPGDVLDLINLGGAFDRILSRIATLVMEPLLTRALGGLGESRVVDIMGKKVDLRVTPTEIWFDPNGAYVSLDTMFLLQGSESSPGFVFTPNDMPYIAPGNGFQFGLADDLVNQMFAELAAVGVLDLSMPVEGGTFDETSLTMTVPPMIQADPIDGKLRVVLGDVIASYLQGGRPVAKAALNARIELSVSPGPDAYSIALHLGTPSFHVDVLDDVPNTTRLLDTDLARGTEVGIAAQIAAMSATLEAAPIPSFSGIQLRDVAAYGDRGFIMVSGSVE